MVIYHAFCYIIKSMRIRTITTFIPLTWPLEEGSIASAARFLNDARRRFGDSDIEIQSVCLATPPFLDVIGDPDAALLLEFAHTLEELAKKHQIDCVSIGPVVATTPLALLMSIHALPQLIRETEIVFSGVLFADEYSGVNLAAAHAFAQTVHKVANSTPNGLGNLRLGALANVPPHLPIPPAAYHHGGTACFAIAAETSALAYTAINSTPSITKAGEDLIKSIETASAHILEVADNLVDDHQIRFKGIDFSLAPDPNQSGSIGAVIENLGVDAFGGSGTLFAIAFLTNSIQQANIPSASFSRVTLPVLEDSVLAQRAAEGRFSVHDLLLYSAICGAGLDIIPIPGNTPPDEMGAIFLDLAALAITVGRPMSARLVPVPGLAVGEKVSFDLERLATGRILPVKNMGAQKLFEQNSFLTLAQLSPRRRTKSETYSL